MYAVHFQFTLSIALHLHSKPQILQHVCHSTQRGRLIGWRQFLKTVASAHWKHPRTHSLWEDPPEHKSSSDLPAFKNWLASTWLSWFCDTYWYIVNSVVILLWYIAPSRQSHSTYLDWIPKAPQSTQGIPEEKCGSPDSHSWDAQWTFRIRSMSTSMAWRKITHCAALNTHHTETVPPAPSCHVCHDVRYSPLHSVLMRCVSYSTALRFFLICSSVILCRDSFKYLRTYRKCSGTHLSCLSQTKAWQR